MLHHFEEYNKYAKITGYHGASFQKAEAYLKSYRKQACNVELQFFEADLIATEEHLYFATLNALKAFKTKTNFSKSAAVETMLYASAQRQIKKAIEHIGIKPESRNLAVVIVGETSEQIEIQLDILSKYFGVAPDEAVLQLTDAKTKKIQTVFQITAQEIETQKEAAEKATVDLVIERMALLSTQF